MTEDWSKRWVAIMAELRADNTIPDPTYDNKVISKARAIKFVAIDVASTNADGEYRFTNEKTYLVSHLSNLKRWFYLGNNPDGKQYADQADSTWPHGLNRTLRNIAKQHFGHPNVTRALREQMREPIFEIDIQLACMSNNPVSPNFYHDFAIFFLTFQSGSRNSPVCKMELSDIVEIRMRPDTCEIFVLLRFHELKAHAPGAEYMRYFSGYLHDHPHWPTDFIWHLHRYLIFRTKGVTGLLRPRTPHPSIYKDARIDLSIMTPTIAELRNGNFTTIKNYDLEGEKLWKRKNVRQARQANNAAIQSRFAFYPEHLLKKMTMHSFRAGFFVSHVTYGVHEPSNGYSIERALVGANFLGNWSSRTAPERYYDKRNIVQRSFNYSWYTCAHIRSLRPTPFIDILASVSWSHMIPDDPHISHNEAFMQEQLNYTITFIEKIVRLAVDSLYTRLTEEIPNFNLNELVGKPEAVRRAIAFFHFNMIQPLTAATYVARLPAFLSHVDEELDQAKSWLKMNVWPNRCKTQSDIFEQTHEVICLPLLNGYVPLRRHYN